MVVQRVKKRPEPPSALPHHETPQPTPNSRAPLIRRSGGNGIIHLNKPTSSIATRRSARRNAGIMAVSLLITIAGLLYLSYGVVMKNMELLAGSQPNHTEQQHEMPAKAQPNKALNNNSDEINHDKCAFRSYPSNRLYGLSSKSQPKFLSNDRYIRGQWPIIINPYENDNAILTDGNTNIQQTSPVKVCVDTTSWENLIDKDGKERLPFTDGHNPSVISLAPNPYSVSGSSNQHMRLDPKHLEPLASSFPSTSPDSLFLGVTIFGGGQCKFGFSPDEVNKYSFSLHDEPQGGKRAVIAILAPPTPKSKTGDDSSNQQSPFQTLAQTTLLLERDDKYGTKRRNIIQPEKTDSGFARMHQEFDDPRLFFHLGRVWVLYRNGPLFGYEDQIHNPIHFEEVSSSGEDGASDVKFVAYVKASETVLICCGRNIALISEEPIGKNENGEVEWASSPTLKALTWVDPITVKVDVDMRGVDANLMMNRRLLEVGDEDGSNLADLAPAAIISDMAEAVSYPLDSSHQPPSDHHRRLGSKPNKSNIHGTNGYMVPLPSTGELMGIAHFHRPENRKPSEFALHGHHYTHALFTIAREANDESNAKDINLRPFRLKRLSNEFVFRANSIPAGETQPPTDGDIIQFASGLDVVGSDVDGQLVISYGINDCEGGVFTLAMQKVQQMLIEVAPGQEVVDVMDNIQR